MSDGFLGSKKPEKPSEKHTNSNNCAGYSRIFSLGCVLLTYNSAPLRAGLWFIASIYGSKIVESCFRAS